MIEEPSSIQVRNAIISLRYHIEKIEINGYVYPIDYTQYVEVRTEQDNIFKRIEKKVNNLKFEDERKKYKDELDAPNI
jgi:hypothetical protein